MQVLLDADSVDRSLRRIAGEIAERTRGAEGLLLVGIRRGGPRLAEKLAAFVQELEHRSVPIGTVDITFYRDDAATRLPNPRIGPSDIPGQLDGRHVVLVDDVLFTGRTVRAALDALLDYGRPQRVELAVLVDRGGRELPIQADYVGKASDVGAFDRVDVVEVDGRLTAIVQSADSPSLPPPPGGPVG
ncbi:MAG TPA: bifunctional pyr operon transcriptional regulator/uracil phosphoribosyltransferase PyrR [Polyangiaceae bacterium]|nr:bifunctional pyr operon transcriptional regulator/uracil phosphoribosyltransferase PyrR [Polyangiaceae bacterium]